MNPLARLRAALAACSLLGILPRRARCKRLANPFIAGAPVLDDRLFFGRESLVTRVLEAVTAGSVLLVGERRIGKTSLLHHLRRRITELSFPRYSFYPVQVDLQGTSEARLFAVLAEDISLELTPILAGPRASSTIITGPGYDHSDLVNDLSWVIDELQKVSPGLPKLVLLIDEFDELNAFTPDTNQKLKGLFTGGLGEHITAVATGTKVSTQDSSWHDFFEQIEVPGLSRADAAELVTAPVRGAFKIDEAVVDRIVERSQGRPFLIQKMCVGLVSGACARRTRKITLSDFEALGWTEE